MKRFKFLLSICCVLAFTFSSTYCFAGGVQVADFLDSRKSRIVEGLGPLFSQEQCRSGILASFSLAQCILESDWCQNDLAINANNLYNMKFDSKSQWCETSPYVQTVTERDKEGKVRRVTERYRKYSCAEMSIKDHSDYLNNSVSGNAGRYYGLKGCTDYKRAAEIMKNGGYTEDPNYVDDICETVELYNLTRFDINVDTSASTGMGVSASAPTTPTGALESTKEGSASVSAPSTPVSFQKAAVPPQVKLQNPPSIGAPPIKPSNSAKPSASQPVKPSVQPKASAPQQPKSPSQPEASVPPQPKSSSLGKPNVSQPVKSSVQLKTDATLTKLSIDGSDILVKVLDNGGGGAVIYRNVLDFANSNGNYDKTGSGAFTIVEVRRHDTSGAILGKLKSGRGWIRLDSDKDVTILRGSYSGGQGLNVATSPSDFMVRVYRTDLPIYNLVGGLFVESGVKMSLGIFAIVEERVGMGRLKDGRGWIALSDAKRL